MSIEGREGGPINSSSYVARGYGHEIVVPSMKYPDGNPKTAFGIKKPPLWQTPMTALYMVGAVHMQGALKYGHYNWRKDPVSASTYLNAAMRHISQWMEGEEKASDSKCHHLAHAVACLNIVMDAQVYDTLIDDRNPKGMKGKMEEFFEEFQETLEFIYQRWGGTVHNDVETEGTDNAAGS